jgi:hypothetical protein
MQFGLLGVRDGRAQREAAGPHQPPGGQTESENANAFVAGEQSDRSLFRGIRPLWKQ